MCGAPDCGTESIRAVPDRTVRAREAGRYRTAPGGRREGSPRHAHPDEQRRDMSRLSRARPPAGTRREAPWEDGA